jgi:hypothetical protein
LVSILIALRDHGPRKHAPWTKSTTASARSTGSSPKSAAATAAAARAWFGRHGGFVIELGDSNHQEALLAFAGNQHGTVIAAFEGCFEGIQPQTTAVAFLAVATEAGGLEDRFDILRVGYARFVRCRGQFG